jgi:hypothetical protein
MHSPFHGERMRTYGLEMAAAADEQIGSWRSGRQYCIAKEM